MSWSFATRQIHAGQTPDTATGARALPIYQTTSFVFDNADVAAARFNLEDLGPIYTRIGNPTTEVVENRLADLEGGVGALLLASGQSASTFSILNVAQAGDHLVASPSLYGGTQNLFAQTLPRLGIEVTFVEDPTDPESWRAASNERTRAFFGESIANPSGLVLDIRGIADVAHEVGVPLIIDNTIATPYLTRPIEHGADIVVHSATKYLGGHGTAIGGVLIDSGNFDYAQYPDKYPGFNEPDEGYHGLTFAKDLGVGNETFGGTNLSYILRARVTLLRDIGPAISPFNAFLIAQGVETLSLRVERHVANAKKVANWLLDQEQVVSVSYAGLPGHPSYELAQRYLPDGAGAVLAFEIAGGLEAGKAFVSALELHSNVANIGDVRSLVIHPASTTHRQLNEGALAAAGVTPGLVRLAVGLEHIDDIIADLETGFRAAKGL
ncbi:bifunctional o-acetylhomoserine/o-acetylserine sulfhydrylase [Ornithinimicrobium ciconiae]|uniref:Bifunctional o-acetylhomoserine/o-acetylserine sulfhydrylase n=1 Tax=Ornithinimicrobium ciconiae TaxID=2594265 RepID=A0A516G7N9_9MICO|nr:bifunctional o-acetylhomoserine/o-acetylserine sulfhydrylase [Ornithinimicrobium ciconiae]QDO87515.1 bifunctional o-acetylhomoserine/o-acetylserine sulfhydrylase [Ornithinimicrobium ciconiae]